jgi:hypothetical protein
MKKIILVLLLSLVSSPSFAEEAQESVEAPSITTIHEPEDQKPENQNTYSIVDENGIIKGNIVCADSVCGETGLFKGVVPPDHYGPNGSVNGPNTGMKLIKQRSGNVGGYWGTYDSNSETFILDRSCSDCDTYKDLYKFGTIKNGIVTDPIIIPGLDTYMLNNPELTIDEAADLLKELLQSQSYSLNAMKSSFVVKGRGVIVTKKTKYKTIKLTPNLKDFKKISRTKNICKIKNNSVLILKSGTCKIDIYKDNKKERVNTKVKR